MNTNTILPATITLTAAAGIVTATVSLQDGEVLNTFRTRDSLGLVQRLDRQMRASGIRRNGYATDDHGDMVAEAFILA